MGGRGMFDVGFIQWLQQFSSPALDTFFGLITDLGSHYAYMAIIPFVYWAVDRRVGRGLAGLFLTSMWLNGLLKEYLVMPRPDPTAVRVLADEPSPGFPSGHAQGAMTLWGYLAVALRRRWLTWLAVILIVLLSVSRLYLGVHFPGDVLGGLALAALLIAVYIGLSSLQIGSALSIRVRMLLIFVIPLLLYPLYQTGTSEQLIGFFIGFFTAEALAGHVVPFRARVGIVQQVIKLIIGYVGFAALVALHMLFVPVGLPAVFGYSIIGIWISMGAPALFRLFGVAGEPPVRSVDRRVRGYMQHYVVTALVVLLFVVGSALYVRQAVPVVARPAVLPEAEVLIIGHRGAAGLAPENTLPSFETALAHGAHMLELDVWPTRDGHIVVLHDATVDRTTNGSGRITEMTLAEVQALDAGYRFTPDGGRTYPWRGQGVVVPTLEEVLRTFSDTAFVIEIKYSDPAVVPAVVDVIDATGARGRVMIGSFHSEVVQRVREVAPDIPTSYGRDEVLRYVIAQRLGVGSFVKPVANALQLPEWEGMLRVVNPGMARLARRQGLDLHVWTINDEETMQRLIALGADAIITDYPDRLQRVLTMMEERSMEQVFY